MVSDDLLGASERGQRRLPEDARTRGLFGAPEAFHHERQVRRLDLVGGRAVDDPATGAPEIDLARGDLVEHGVDEPGLVDAVLDQIATGKVDLGRTGRGVVDGSAADQVETPYLSLVMERLWRAEQAAGSRVLRQATLSALGGAEQIVRDHLDDALE